MNTCHTSPMMWPSPYACAQSYNPSNVAAMGSCFGLLRPHQHGVADTCRGRFFSNAFGRQLHIPNVVIAVEKSTAVLPRHAYGQVDPVTSDLCEQFLFMLKKLKVSHATPAPLCGHHHHINVSSPILRPCY